jgi:hypothetical protein
MSREAFDPNAFTVEDIFRAKLARRQRLAKLPFEQKIEILKKLQQVPIAMMRNEKLIFASFLEAYPDLAGEIAEWDVVEEWYLERAIDPPPHPFDKRPDIIAVTKLGKKIGVELKSWVNREQITAARKQERIGENIKGALGKLPLNPTQHIGYVTLYPKEVRFDGRHAADFREQLFRWIEDADCKLSHRPAWARNSSENPRDFPGFPLLEKYLNRIQVKPANVSRKDYHWIQTPSSTDFYSPNTMREILKRALLAHRNDERYKDLRPHVGLDEVYLLVHYDFKAFAYDTRFDAPGFGFNEAANLAKETLNGDGGYFDRIFLFHFLSGQEKAERIV